MLIRRLLWPRDSHALHGPTVSGVKTVAWTAPMDLALFKEAKNRIGATVNDVLMACVSGALSRYLLEHAGEVVDKFHVSMPVNIRATSTRRSPWRTGSPRCRWCCRPASPTSAPACGR